jgi:hypothetical protein
MKMMLAYMILPAFYLFYFLAVKMGWKKSKFPYIVSSTQNPVLELALGNNGISRLTSNQGSGIGGEMKD